MNWLQARASEKSTWGGLAAIGVAALTTVGSGHFDLGSDNANQALQLVQILALAFGGGLVAHKES